MNLVNKKDLSQQQTTICKEQTFEKEIDSVKKQTGRKEKIKIHIKFTLNQKINYSYNGTVLRVVEDPEVLNKPEIFNTMDQICNISWQGQYDQNKKKEGKWVALWDKELIQNVGGQSCILKSFLYLKQGEKLGLWKDLCQNYSNQVQIYEIGEYNKDYKIGKWNYLYNEEMIDGGGFYNKNGQKQGKWAEVDEGFFDLKKVTYNGEYNMNNMKVGKWDIMYCKHNEKEYKQNGGGSYDQEGNQKKIGKWVELYEKFEYLAQITYNGEYNKNNMKVGKWDIMYCKYNEKEYKQINISNLQLYIYSGGGSYDLEGNQKKIGKWIELFEGFYYYAQVTHNGEYNMNNMKVDRWDIMYCQLNQKEYKQINISIVVVDNIDQEGNQKKIGKWVELDEKFYYNKQVTYIGEYNMNNMKVGRWDIMQYKNNEEEYKQIGGGSYDQEGNQKKIGKWVELDEGFREWNQVTFNGEYNMNGHKVGIWEEMDIKENKKRGEKRYDN